MLRRMLCLQPRRPDGKCEKIPIPGEDGTPCRGWGDASFDGGLVDGRLGCWTCDDDFGSCIQGTSCEGVRPDGKPQKGLLRCDQ